MGLIPSGLSIQEAYRRYRNGQIMVNRKYQRKLVWTEKEKQMLIDSILHEYPIPLILFAERQDENGIEIYEILDGMQRLNAIFGFIENEFSINNKYFDVGQLARAKQLSDAGIITTPLIAQFLSETECANFLDYQLAATSYQTIQEDTIIEIFGRINSGGRRLSNQEKRQAGISCEFSDLVRSLAADIRGDSTNEIILLPDMPQISIGSNRINDNYGLKAEDIFWVKQGILAVQNLRDSDDEEIIADIAISILLNQPFPRSKELLDEAYNPESTLYKEIEASLYSYSVDKLKLEIKNTFSVLKNTIESISLENNFFRKTIYPTSRSPVKNGFYTVFMAFHHLLVEEDLSPYDNDSIINSLKNLQSKITMSTHYTNTADRNKNIDLTIGLIQKYFVKKVPSTLKHGAGLAIDFENSILRSKIETPRYEFKQGFLRLSDDRKYDKSLEDQITKTICAMANIGPDTESFIFIGVSDKEDDARRISELDNVEPIRILKHHVVGIEREAKLLNISVEDYCRRIVSFIRSSPLMKELITSVLSNIDVIEYKNMTVIRIKVTPQKHISYYGDDVYIRQHNETKQMKTAKEIMAVASLFNT
ncbi:DUF262 domain-containing protein [Anaerocolumna sp.]|uniref:DUF262 domain-containing protein n=1 Tax=Anaerocolumna sp. TaxID=2041569 RepID=UPI0028B1826A|nr:DUF262 domain-containing protein [Anaerocolumna sp.]